MRKDIVTFSDFNRLDLRVGKVLSVEVVEGSRNLIRMKVDLGKEYGEKKILAGLGGMINVKELIGKKYIFIANLEPKQMMKELSEAMILVAEEGEKIHLIPVEENVPEGAVVR